MGFKSTDTPRNTEHSLTQGNNFCQTVAEIVLLCPVLPGAPVLDVERLLVFLQLVSESAVDAGDRVMGVQVDVDLGVSGGGGAAAVAGHHPLVDHDNGNLGDHVDGPILIHLLRVHVLKSYGSTVFFGPSLACMGNLVIEPQGRDCD